MAETVVNFDYKKNSLNTVRLIAALQVLYLHAIVHLEVSMPMAISTIINFFQGVPIFFTMSGFLIWDSIGRSSGFGEYCKKRFWRIYPELWVAVVVELIVIVIFVPIRGADWTLFGLFAIGQSTIFQFWTPDFLRVYGVGCPNGALWTICILIQFYFFAWFIYKLLHGRKHMVWWIVILITLLIACFNPNIVHLLGDSLGKLYGITLLPYLWMFVLAMYFAENKHVFCGFFKNNWYIFILITIVVYLLHLDIMASYGVIKTICQLCGLLGVAYALPRLNIKTDISYGLYIYHMTIVNALIELGMIGRIDGIWLLVITIIVSCMLAYASTNTVGRWSMTKKSLV